MKKILASILVIVLLFMCGCATAETSEEPTPAPTINLKDIPVIEIPPPAVDRVIEDSIENIVEHASIIVTGTVEKIQDPVSEVITPISFKVEKCILGDIEEGALIEYYIEGGERLTTDENGEPVIYHMDYMNEVKLPKEGGHYIQFLAKTKGYGYGDEYEYTYWSPIHGSILEVGDGLSTHFCNKDFYKDMNFEEAVAMLEELVEKYHKQ